MFKEHKSPKFLDVMGHPFFSMNFLLTVEVALRTSCQFFNRCSGFLLKFGAYKCFSFRIMNSKEYTYGGTFDLLLYYSCLLPRASPVTSSRFPLNFHPIFRLLFCSLTNAHQRRLFFSFSTSFVPCQL